MPLTANKKVKKERILNSLSEAIKERSSDKAENAVTTVHQFGYDPDFVPLLIELLESDWHFRHEDIALALQWSKDNRATNSLLKTAKIKFDYLNYDDSYSLARKCVWALTDIGTDESKQALFELSQWHDQKIASYAQKRLDNWEEEKDRKAKANTNYI